MKIGIITFHWATNYGAVLQAYALQEYLKKFGYEVEIINYKPSRYDWFTYKTIFKNPLKIKAQLRLSYRERLIRDFRSSFLLQTKRYRSMNDLKKATNDYDVVISGSDQVLNPTFTAGGEGKPTDAYYLGFAGKNTRKVGYAVSFGCGQYPEYALEYAYRWINNFDAVGVRENSGINVLEQLNYKGVKKIVPDPTLLYGRELFENLYLPAKSNNSDLCVYMLSGIVAAVPQNGEVKIIDEYHHGQKLEEWLVNIRDTKFLVTNSYHGMLMAILFHTPFAVIRNAKASGQNDRITTVLGRLGLEERLVDNDGKEIAEVMNKTIDWKDVDEKCEAYRIDGKVFLNKVILENSYEDLSN